MSKFFGGKDPFDDPFFSDPYAGMYYTKKSQIGNQSKEVTIEELDSDGNISNLASDSTKDDVVRNPNAKKADNNSSGQNASGSKSFSYQRVSYGGINGMYYTASVTRKAADDDGVVFMEINEEDKTVGEALNTVSRGVRNKGHSATTRRTSDGKVDTMQTLHNLNEDELPGFEEAWRSDSQSLPPDWKSGPNLLENADTFDSEWSRFPSWGGLMLPSTGDDEPSGGRTKKVVRINVE